MTSTNELIFQKKYIVAAYTLLAAFTLAGMFIPLMDNDAGEYAIVAMRMAKENDFINIVRKSEDYLDKPHLLFWLSAISMKIFGFTSFAYKLPSVLFSIAGIYATTKLGTLLYNKHAGLLAGLVVGYAQAYIFSSHDVRTDAILTGATILAIYKFIQYSYTKNYTSIILGSLFLALAVGTKGMVAVLVTGSCVFIHLLYQRQGQEIFGWKWLSSIIWFFIFLSPFLYCYYLQFDAHPEKIVKGAQNVSGVKFLLWTQSFERLSGQNNMVDNPDYFFFFHTLLWAFLPWSIITYFSMYKDLASLIKNRFRQTPDVQAALSCSTLILFLIFSASKFKLPHYLNILFPMLAIVTAQNMVSAINNNKFRWMGGVLTGISVIYLLATIIVNGWAFPVDTILAITTAIIAVVAIAYTVVKLPASITKPLILVLVVAGFCNLLINLNFYPKMLAYQGGNTLAEYVNTNRIDKSKINYYVSDRCFSFDYYSQTDVPERDLTTLQQMRDRKETFYVVTDNGRIKELIGGGIQMKEIKTVGDFHVSQLTLPFINPARRQSTLDQLILVQVN